MSDSEEVTQTTVPEVDEDVRQELIKFDLTTRHGIQFNRVSELLVVVRQSGESLR